MSRPCGPRPADTSWHRIDAVPDEGRVQTAIVDGRSVAVTRCGGRVGALDNHCPHQGGPLGEGSIENGLLRCPWHGYDYDPMTGTPPAGFSDAPRGFPVEVRADGVYVAAARRRRARAHRVRRDGRDDGGVGRRHTCSAWSATPTSGSPTRCAAPRSAASSRFIGIRHEGAAAFAASAYGKLTGRPAACFAIAGPGSTNLLTGLYDAKVDGAPVLAISGQVPSKVLGRGAFQDLDLSAVFRDVALSTVTVHAGSDHAELAATAVKHALDGRGVAHLVLPDEVQDLPSDAPGRRAATAAAPTCAVAPSPTTLRRRAGPAAGRPPTGDHRRAGRARGHRRSVRELAERLGAPVLTTFQAKGLVPDNHPLGAGVLGRSGTPVASWLMNESDLLLVFGASFANHTGIAPYKPIVQVDDAPVAIGRFHPVDVGGARRRRASSLRALLDSGSATTDGRRPAARRRRALGDLARGEGAPRAPTTAAGASPAPPSSPPCPRTARPTR